MDKMKERLIMETTQAQESQVVLFAPSSSIFSAHPLDTVKSASPEESNGAIALY